MKKLSSLLCLFALTAAAQIVTPVKVDNVQASQSRSDQKLTVTYDVAADEPVYVQLDVFTNGVSIGRQNVRTFQENSAVGLIAPGEGKSIVWNARRDLPDVLDENTTVQVSAFYAHDFQDIPSAYMVVDLANSFAVSYTLTPPDIRDLSYAKSKLWLRRCEAGTFMMGSPTTENNRTGNEALHQVTLTKPFFVGVFPVTRRQWQYVTGSAPAGISNNYPLDELETLPATQIGYTQIADFAAQLSEKTGWTFQLPTDAQWEYACRAGCKSGFYNGFDPLKDTNANDPNLNRIAWNKNNSEGKMHRVGTREPNDWGIYDTLGNIYEFVRDYWQSDVSALTVDPFVSSGTTTTLRGNDYNSDCRYLRCAARPWGWALTNANGTPNVNGGLGFRISITLD